MISSWKNGLPSSASQFSLSLPLRSRSLVVGPRGPTRCVFAIVCLCACQFMVYTITTEIAFVCFKAFGTFIACCGLYVSQFDKSLSADMHCQSWWMPPPHTLLQLTVTQVLLSTVNFVLGVCEELKIVTFNTNGLGLFKKRKHVFDFLRKQSANIFLLQETLENGQRMWSDHSGV